MTKNRFWTFFSNVPKWYIIVKNDVSGVSQSDLTHPARSHSPISNFYPSSGASETHFSPYFDEFPRLRRIHENVEKNDFLTFVLNFLKMFQTFRNDVSEVSQSDLTHAARSHSPISHFRASPGTSETHFSAFLDEFPRLREIQENDKKNVF